MNFGGISYGKKINAFTSVYKGTRGPMHEKSCKNRPSFLLLPAPASLLHLGPGLASLGLPKGT